MNFKQFKTKLKNLLIYPTDLSRDVDVDWVVQKTMDGIVPDITAAQLSQFAIEISASKASVHPSYSDLASRIAVSDLHENTEPDFVRHSRLLAGYVDHKCATPLISQETLYVVERHADRLQAALHYERDYLLDLFGLKTLERSYLLRMFGKVVERPQHMWMRVSIGIHGDDIDAVVETYDAMSLKMFTHATPTLFNSGTPRPQMASCFLLAMQADSIEGIYATLTETALISKYAGGIGLSISNVRANDSYIAGTNGRSNGIVPMLRVFNTTARYIDQGGGKRKGSFAIYLEPWHADIRDFIALRKNQGAEERRCRDLFLALWVPDEFMRRVENGELWSLFCPHQAPGLADVWGDDFDQLYRRYEKEGLYREQVDARELFNTVLQMQIETGVPYMLYKDHINRASNQNHLGTIKSSNLCTEIVQFTSPEEIAVCNLASLSLPSFVRDDSDDDSYTCSVFDYGGLGRAVRHVTRNLNRVIDRSFYPLKKAERSNKQHRPMGIGVQGLADVFMRLRVPFDGDGAREINRKIFETMYFNAVWESTVIAERDGPHGSFEGSLLSRGVLHPDVYDAELSSDLDWDGLRRRIAEHGTRNSLFVAPMPTASTSQILGNNECFEPYTSNIYSRRVLAGEFTIVNRHLVRDLENLGLWSVPMKNAIVAQRGSVQRIKGIPDDLKALYRTVWEISQKKMVQLAIDRQPFVDQSQSMNVFLGTPTLRQLTSLHFFTWNNKLKTGLYYLRTRPDAAAVQFTIDRNETSKMVADEEPCLSCGS